MNKKKGEGRSTGKLGGKAQGTSQGAALTVPNAMKQDVWVGGKTAGPDQ